jgi:hypothetical protein
MLRKVMNTLDDAQRHSAQALIEPTFLDAMCTGYIIPAPIDVEVDLVRRDGELFLPHRMALDVGDLLELWKPFPDGHFQQQIVGSPWHDTEWILKLRGFWHIQTPPGYSCLFVAPQLFSTENLPLYALPGIVETDRYRNMVSFPMIPMRDYPIKIPAGMPLVHVVPFKRTDWKAEYGSLATTDS